MTNMAKATVMTGPAASFLRIAAASALVASAAIGVSQATAAAEPESHQVRYTITTAAPYDFDLFYLTAQPPDKAAYNADPYSFVKNEKVNLSPDAPWVFETTLADPQWAIMSVSSTARGAVGAPNAHCEIAVDGQVVVQQDAPYNPRCQLTQW
jgi:hypothetical protein